MATSVVLGPDAKIDIGDPNFGVVPCRVLSGKIHDKLSAVEKTTDTDSPNGADEFFSDTYGNVELEVEIQLDTDDANGTAYMFSAPLLLTPGGTIPITIWPEGRDEGESTNSEWIFYNVLMTEGTHGFVVRGSVPQGAMILGISSGYFKRPYENNIGGSYLPPYAESLTQIGDRASRPIGEPPLPLDGPDLG